MKKRYTEEQIIKILAEVESGIPLAEVARKYGISTASYYKWKAKFGGMDISEARRLKALEEENRKLKRVVADQALDIVALKDILSKKW
jgi:putative transposase